MSSGVRRIRRLLSLEKPKAGSRPTQPAHATPQTAGERTLGYHQPFGPRQGF